MFERYTEKARRVIFFARYEASQYGSPYIETEHLLLGLLREDDTIRHKLLPKLRPLEKTRKEIEEKIEHREQILTSTEVPLAAESQHALVFAGEEAERLGHRHVGTEHLLLGLLRVEAGLASAILALHGAKLRDLREKLAASSQSQGTANASRTSSPFNAEEVLTRFFAQLRAGQPDEARDLLAPEAQYIDPRGNCWAGKEGFQDKMSDLLAPFAARSAKYKVEDSIETNDGTQILTIFWEDVPLPEKPQIAILRMIVVLTEGEGGIFIYSMQITPIVRS